jgi:GNAT superfamily N-acetyltransferase
MSSTPTVRPARVEDAQEIARLSGELGYATPAEVMRERLAALMPHPDHRITVLDNGDGLLGWVASERRRILEAGERIEIIGLVVDARCRGMGLGRVLVTEAEYWARQLGFDAVSVRSNVLRDSSHPFYERMGYARRKTQHFYVKELR